MIDNLLLSEDTVRAYIAERSALRQWGVVRDVTEIGDGYLNHVFRLRCDGGTLVLKQSMPYVRIDPSWELTPTRIVHEANAYRIWRAFAPGVAPELYDFDPAAFVMVVEDFTGHVVWREALNRGAIHATAAAALGRFVAQVAFYTGEWGTGEQPRDDGSGIGSNVAMATLMEQVIFEFPYTDHPHNSYSPAVADLVEVVRHDTEYRAAVTQLQFQWTGIAEALIHGDLHTGSVMVAENSTHVIDSEFSFYGPVAWDLGELIGNLLIATVRGCVLRSHLQPALDGLASQVWTVFEGEFASLWEEHHEGHHLDALPRAWLRETKVASIGFAGLEMVRRIIGSGKADDVASLSGEAHIHAVRAILVAGKRLVLERESLDVRECVAVVAEAVEATTR